VTKKNRTERLARRAARVVSILEIFISPKITSHAGVTDKAIEAAVYDPNAVIVTGPRASRSGKTYREGGSIALASAGPSGPFLHLGYEIEQGRIIVYHARLMNDQERLMYTRGR
jgi:hypothetical protein